MRQEVIPNVLIRLTNVTGFDHTHDSNLAFRQATEEIERLLAQERLKVIESSPECWHYTSETEQEFMERYFAWRKKNLAELEKARASEKNE